MKQGKRLVSWLLALVMLLGLLPGAALAALEGPYATGEKDLIFNLVSLSGAGAANMDDWASGEYPGVREALLEELGEDADTMSPDFLKTRVMVRAMHFNSWDDEEPIAFYIPANTAGSTHELTLYAMEDVDVADITLAGVRLTGEIERHVFGDVDSEGSDGRLWWYTVPIFVPMEDVEMEIYVKGELYATLPMIHVRGESPFALYTTMQVWDYEEGEEPGTVDSLTLRVSGFSLPEDRRDYTYRWLANPEEELEEDQWASVDGAELTEPDEYGYRLVKFELLGVPSDTLIWGQLGFDNARPAYFFSVGNHLENFGTAEEPDWRFKTDYDFTDPNEPYGVYAEVPSPYYCIFKEPAGPGEEPEVMPELVVLGDTLPGGAVSTQAPSVTVYQNPGSYLGGDWRLSADGRSWNDWLAADGDQSRTELSLGDSGAYGDYTVYAQFRKEGLKTVTLRQAVCYNDGAAPAPTKLGALDKAANTEVPRQGSAAVLKVSDGAAYVFYAEAPEGLTVKYAFRGTALSGDMTWNAAKARYELSLGIDDIPREANALQVWSSGDSAGYTRDSAKLELPLVFREAGFLRPLYAPTVPYEVKKDEAGEAFFAVAPGAQLSGVFEAAVGAGRTQQMTLVYLAADGSRKTVSAPAAGDANNQFTAVLPLPEDAESLVSVRYELLLNGETEESAEYDLRDYRIWARSFLTGVLADYAGAKIDLRDGRTVRSYFVTADNYASIPLGDLPGGDYQYVIDGASGHIAKGSFSLTRGEDVALSGLPALGSVTVVTTGITSSLTGQEINPSAAVNLTLTTPDGTNCRLLGVTGEVFRQIPVGSTGTTRVNFYTDREEISACTTENGSFTVSGDETVTYAYQPFTYRTISGSLWGMKTDGAGRVYGFAPKPTSILVTQEIDRGGRTETVTFNTTLGYGPSGRWSVLCYDNVPAKVEFRCFTWDTQTVDVTENGDVNLGQINMTYGDEMLIRIDAELKTGRTLKEDGSEYFGAGTSVVSPIDSAFLKIGYVSAGGHSYYASSGKFETVIKNGQLYVKLAEGVVVGSEQVYVNASGNYTTGGVTVSLPYNSYVLVKEDENGQPCAKFTAEYAGGEFRTTVVDPDSEYVGFLLFRRGDGCIFTYGRGELSLPYSWSDANRTDTVAAFMVPEKDAEDMAEQLSSGGAKVIWDLLPTDGGWSSYFFNEQYRGQILYKSVSSYSNAVVYLEDLQPTKPVLTGVLPPYVFSYRYELTDSPNTVRLVGTLSKRYPDQTNQDKLRSQAAGESALTLYTMEDRNQGSAMNATVPMTMSDLGGGQTLLTAELPLSYVMQARFRLHLTYWHDSVTSDRGYHSIDFTHEDHVQIFSLSNPGDVYITDQLDAQGLTGAKPEAQATWYLNLGLRAFISTDPEENQITIYDNGTPIYSYDVGAGRLNYYGWGSMDKLRVRLTDNLQPGIHVVWANRTVDGETVSTEPVVFSVLEGRENNSVYVSDLHWTHWNSRLGGGEPDIMYYPNLSDLAGANIWIWPSHKHYMQFRVNNATSDELDGVNVVYQALWASNNMSYKDDPVYGYYRASSSSGFQGYNLVTRAVPCKLITENKAGNYSIWGIDEFYMGYLQSFEFEFDYNAAIDKELATMTEQDLSDLESASFYKANGLGEVPDDLAQVAAIDAMSAQERTAMLADMSQASQALQGLDLQVTEDSAKRLKMELKTPTKELSEYTVTMEKGGTMELPDILLLMEKERSEGNQNPAEQGWDVTWAEFETLQGSTLLRIASFEGKDATGRNALLTHTTYYVTKSVADALEGGGSGKASLLSRGSGSAFSLSAPRSGEGTAILLASDPAPDAAKPDHWTKQLYDGTSLVYSGYDLTDEAWKAYCAKDFLKANPGDLDGAKAFADSESLIPKKLDATMKVLGVADTVITYAKGPSGADPNGLRQLLTYVRDEKARRSLEMQIRDYESLRYDIYKQDCAMSTYSTASNFSPMGPIGKVVVFVGGLANGLISGWSKDYNREVYNTTLHDIQLQIKYEAVKAERLKKSFQDAEQWLRDKMDSIYGKGAWSEYALAEERKNWVLKEYPGGILKYEWRDKAPAFSVTQDPSGYVYEAVTEDTIEGVTATLYYSETEDGSYSLWTDPFGEQPNPQDTSETGNYMWMVPIGWWKVRYEKEGYKISESVAMPVPPIHTTVNVGLLSEEAPQVTVRAGEGEMDILFTKYMQLESLIRLFGSGSYTDDSFDASAFTVQFYDAEGLSVPGTVTFPDVRENTGYKGTEYGTDIIDSDWFVRYAVFTPDDASLDLSGVTWKLADGMVSYAGVALDGETSSLHILRLEPGEGTLTMRTLVTDETGRVPLLPEPVLEGFRFLGWFTSPEGGEQKTAADSFTEDLTLYAHWEEIEDTGAEDPVDPEEPEEPEDTGDWEDETYPVEAAKAEHGTVTVRPDEASEGTTVTVTVTPDEGYILDTLTVTDGSGRELTLTEKDGKYTFLMPDSEVTVTATFRMKEESTDNPFADVAEDAWYADAVLYCYAHDYFKGTGEDTFEPGGQMTRAMFATVLWRIAGKPEAAGDSPFTDVEAGKWYTQAIAWAAEKGILLGYGGGIFGTNDPVTREQIVTIFWRYLARPEAGDADLSAFRDAEEISAWAKDAFRWAIGAGIIRGKGNGILDPLGTATRAEVAQIVMNYDLKLG